MNELSIKAEGLGKEYIIGGAEEQYDSFRDMLSSALRSPLRKFKKLSGSTAQENRFWALQDINFEINQGDVIGVIGHNGAGKSTLLKLLSRITAPTVGRIEIHGRVASLLEVGTGFHPELTGRENIYLNGSILGMQRSQINQKFDEIVQFAEITKFLDTPVKRYSSGMYVRLAFSIAAHLDTDVLLVDEVLAVGDQNFQKRCLGKLGDVSSQGRTVIFVSHNLSAVSSLCKSGILLNQGAVVTHSNIEKVLSVYESMGHQHSSQKKLSLDNPVCLQTFKFDNEMSTQSTEFAPGKSCCIQLELDCFHSLDNIRFNIGIYNEREQRLALLSSENSFDELALNEGSNSVLCNIQNLPLVAGRYYMNFAVIKQGQLLNVVERAAAFTIRDNGDLFSSRNTNGPILFNYDWTMR